MKRKQKRKLSDDFGIRIYLSDGIYEDATKSYSFDEKEDDTIDERSIELSQTRLKKYAEVSDAEAL